MGPPASHQIPRAWCYSGAISVYALFRLRDLYPLRCVFPNLFDYRSYVLSDGPQPRIVNYSVWPLSLSLAATLEIDFSFSSSGYLDVSVPRVSFSQAMYLPVDNCTLLQLSSLIRISAGQRIFAPYRSFSQLVTSFFGSQCQGIRLVLFLA